MSNFLNRATKVYLLSVNDPDYPLSDWIKNPDLSAVAGFASKYWIITGDAVSLMNQSQRDAVDAAELSAKRDGAVAPIDAVEDILRAFALTLLDELNLHAARVTAILDAVDASTSLATLKSAVALINDVPQRTIGQLKTAMRGKLGT